MENKIRLGSAGIIVHEDKVLLGRRNKEPNFGKWVLPGGKVEFGESIAQAVVREIREEIGIDVDYLRVADNGVYEIIDKDAGEHRVIVYSLLSPRTFDVKPSSDISEARFFTRQELPATDLSPVVRQVLSDLGWL